MAYAIESLIKIAVVVGAIMGVVAYLSLAERRVSGFIQNRLGPNRVGPFGLLQPLADGLKFLFKEDVIPRHVTRVIYIAGPVVVFVPAFIGFAVVPFGDTFSLFGQTIQLQVADLNIGILYILAVSSLAVYGVVLGGWASNNKYALLGGIRASAQMISYELALGLSLIGVLMITGSLRLNDVVAAQATNSLFFGFLPRWNIFTQPLAFVIFTVAAFAETNRLPFDLPETEQELVAGYHAEYSSMKFTMFMMAEYAHMITASAVISTLFFGGWHCPGVAPGDTTLMASLLKVLAFSLKTGFFLFFYIWVRWTLPRFRYDQVMRLGWKMLLPLALANVFVTGLILTLSR